MQQYSSTSIADIYTGNFTSPTEATSTSSSKDITPFQINLIIAAFTVVLAIILLIFIYLMARKLTSTCCQVEPKLGIYDIMSAEESLCNECRNYDRQISSQDELSPVLDINISISDNASLWYDSEYENLSMEPEVPDTESLDSPPDYEHPPEYESATRRVLGNYEKI